jgi:flagellar biosynthesis protein FliQ
VALEIKNLRDLLLFWLLWSTTFSFALTATCLVRQPASAAILALGAVGILFAIPQAIFGDPQNETLAAMPALITAFLAAFFLSTLLGAYAANRDLAIS